MPGYLRNIGKFEILDIEEVWKNVKTIHVVPQKVDSRKLRAQSVKKPKCIYPEIGDLPEKFQKKQFPYVERRPEVNEGDMGSEEPVGR